jgi:hypothetical protein
VIELKGKNLWAVPYRNRRELAPVKLMDGCIVEELLPGQAHENFPKTKGVKDGTSVPAYFEIEGTDSFVRVIGRYVLPSGDVAAVYGGEAETITLGWKGGE